MKQRIIKSGIFIFLLFGVVGLWNYIKIYRPATRIILSDQRNKGINVCVHYKWFVDSSTLIFNLLSVSEDNSPADVTRTLLQSAKSLKDVEFKQVILSFKGTPKFILKGNYYQDLGLQYENQNPIYTLRTLPENVYNVEGKQAFGEWTGGILGVVGKQMEDLQEFYYQWFLSDLTNKR